MYESKDKMVSHPDHYQSNDGLEVIDVIKAFTADLNGIEAYDTGNIIKYACRWPKKNGIQDLEKIIWYAHHLIDHLKSKDQTQEVEQESPKEGKEQTQEVEQESPKDTIRFINTAGETVFYKILTPEEIFEEYKRQYGDFYNMKDVVYKAVPDELNTIYIWHDIHSTDCYAFYYDGTECSCVEGPDLEFFETKEPEIYKPEEE